MYALRFPGAISLLSRGTARAGPLLALLAGLTACAVALLVLTTVGSTAWSVLYLLLFGIGTIAG